jgi:hypothetical protein
MCQTLIQPEIDAHLERAGGFDANRRLAILGGDTADLTRYVPNATFKTVLPTHLKPPANVLQDAISSPVITELPPGAASTSSGTSLSHSAAPVNPTRPLRSRPLGSRTAASIPPAGSIPGASPAGAATAAANLVDLLSGHTTSSAAAAASASFLQQPPY